MPITYTGKLLDSQLSGGKCIGRALHLVRDAARERNEAFVHMGGTSVSSEETEIDADTEFGDVNPKNLKTTGFKTLTGGRSIFKDILSSVTDNYTVGHIGTTDDLASPITKGSYDSTSPTTINISPYDRLTYQSIRLQLGYSLGDIAHTSGAQLSDKVLDLYRCGAGLLNHFKHSPATQSQVVFNQVVTPRFATSHYEGGPFASVALAEADIAATSGAVSTVLNSKLTGVDTAKTKDFSSNVLFRYDFRAEFHTPDYYSSIAADLLNQDQVYIQSPSFKDTTGSASTGSTKLAGRTTYFKINDLGDTNQEDVNFNHTLSTFDLLDTQKTLDVPFTLQFGTLTEATGFIASDYSACFTSTATIT